MRHVVEQFRDISDWWITEVYATYRSVLSLRRPRRADSKANTKSDKTNSSPRSRNLELGEHQLVFSDRYVALPASFRNLPYIRSVELAKATALEKTPFDLDDVSLIPIQDHNLLISSVLIKRDRLANFLSEAQSGGAKPEALGINRDGSTIWLPRRALETLHPIFSHLRRRRQWLTAALTMLLIIVGATYGHLYLRYSAAEEQLIAAADAKREEALNVRKLLDQQQKNLAAVEAARTGKNQAVPVVRIWEEVTRTIPDDAWITDLSFDGDTITLSGYAARSSGLIGDIASSPIFKDPSFVSPVVRVPGQSGERFELRAKVSQP